MQLFKKGQAESAATNDAGSASKGKTSTWFSNNKRSIAAVTLIVIAALFMRTVFAYAISAGSGFALSGGTIASEHLRNVSAMITSGSFFGIDVWMFAPDGSINVHPPLIDMIAAGIGSIIKMATGWTAEQSAAAALGGTSAVMGALACIPAYYLGKEIFNGKKRAGFLAALFIAFCPVVISNTVFSNGTGIAFVLFFVICMLYFAVKGVKAIDNDHTLKSDFKTMFAANKTAMKYALFTSIFMILIAYSWNGFRTLVMLMLLIMICVMIVNRLKVVDARPAVMFFSTIILLTVAVAAPYYCVCGLWDLVFSGIVYAAAIGLVVCISFALLQSKPWVYTIPAYIVVVGVVFAALYFAVPDVFNVIVNGNSVYAQEVQKTIGGTGLSLSAIATYFGWLTMWCGTFIVIYMAFKFLKNSNNTVFLVSFFALIIGMLLGIKSTAHAVVYSPFFAVGFAGCIVWLFDNVNFHDYFKSFHGCNYKTIWRKLVNPKPFFSILCVLLLIAAPNMMTAIDASISNNEKSDWNEGSQDLLQKTFVGSMGYSVLTDEDYKINYTFKQYGSTDEFKGQTVLTWYDYSADLVTYGHFKSVTDTRGNNAVAAAQILLGDETKGEATAAMIVYSMQHMGFKEAVEWMSSQGYFTEEGVKERLLEVGDNMSSYKNLVLRQQGVYGQLQSDISEENVLYIFLKKYLTVGQDAGADVLALDGKTGGTQTDKNFTGYSSWKLSQMYAAIADHTNTKIDKVMATVNMIPIQIGDGSVFESMAKVAGYATSKASTSYGNFDYVPVFYTINTSSLSYTYTTALYNSLVYKIVGGKTSEEATQSHDSSVFESVYGLSNFNPDYKHFYVKYNSDSSATSTSDGWKTLAYEAANTEKTQKGGVVNYFGYPVFVDVVDYTSTQNIHGNVLRQTGTSDGDEPVKDVRVELWNGSGYKLATAYTDKNGYYQVPYSVNSEYFENCTIKFYAGAATTATTGGTLVSTQQVTGAGEIGYTIGHTTFSGYVNFKDSDITEKYVSYLPSNVKVTITGTNFKKVYETEAVSENGQIRFSFDQYLVIDTYSVKVTTVDGTSLGTGSYTLAQGQNNDFVITGTICEETITVVDENSIPIADAYVTLTNEKSDLTIEFWQTNKLGVTSTNEDNNKVYLAPGTYNVRVQDESRNDLLSSTTSITVSSSTSTHTINITEKSKKVTINPNGFDGESIYITNGSYTALATKGDDGSYSVMLPLCSLDNINGEERESYFTAYALKDGKVYYTTFLVSQKSEIKLTNEDAVNVHGKITKVTDGDPAASAGTVYFKSGHMIIISEAVKYDNTDDYVYSAYLPKGIEFNMCTTEGSSFVTYEKATFNEDTTKDIKMEKGYSISGKFYWGTSVYFKYVLMHVSGIENVDNFDVITDSTGSYSVMIPEGKTCKVTTPSLKETNYYFNANEKTEERQAAQSYEFSTDKKTNNFYAYANNTQGKYKDTGDTKYNYVVVNASHYDFYIGSNLLKAGGNDDKSYMTSSSSLTHPYITIVLKYVQLDKGENSPYYYATINIPIEVQSQSGDECVVYTIDDTYIGNAEDIKSYATKYQEVKITYTGDKAPSVSITNMRSSDLIYDPEDETSIIKPFANLVIKDGTNNTDDSKSPKYIQKFISYNDYYGEVTKDVNNYELSSPYLLKITRTFEVNSTTETRVFYSTLLGDENYVFDANADSGIMKKSVAYTGVTGSSYSGNVVFKWKDADKEEHVMTSTISSGSYSVNLPADTEYEVYAKVTNKVNETTYVYKSEPIELTTPTNVDSAKLNLVVTLQDEEFNDTDEPKVILAISKDGMTLDETTHIATVNFTATLSGATVYDKTYLLSGGSAWSTIKFYKDEAHTEEITTTSAYIASHDKVYCVGTFKLNYLVDGEPTTTATAALDNTNLTVIFSEANGTAVARGQFSVLDENWKSTTLPLQFGPGTNQYGQGQTVFSTKVINPNNTPVAFKLGFALNANETNSDVYYVVHFDKYIFTLEEGKEKVIWIPGATTTEVQVEVIYKDGSTENAPKNITLTYGEVGSSYELRTIKDAKGVEISDDKHTATVKINISDTDIDIKDHDASGRGVFNTLGSAPVYLMVLGALVLLAVIAMLWLGSRRGVFARRK